MYVARITPVYLFTIVIMGSSMNRLFGLFSLSLLIACSSYEENSHGFRIFKENGITITETTGGPRYNDELFQYDIELVIPPGDTEESALGFPRQFYSDSDGYLYIVDERKAAVLVYHPNGQYSHTIGRKGYGPGDLQHPRVQDVRDGKVTLFDLPTRRLSFFSFEGKLIETISAPSVSGMLAMNWNTRVFHILPNGNQMLLFRHQDMSSFREPERVSALFLSATGDTLANVGTSWVETGYPVEGFYTFEGRRTTSTRGRQFPYGPKPTSTFNSQIGFVIGNGVDPILTVYDFNAEIQKEIRIIQEPERVDAEMKQQVTKAVEDKIQSSEGVSRLNWQEYLENLSFPTTIAFSADVEVEDSGFIWIKVPQFPTGIAEYTDSTWRLISPEGEYLGTTVRPEDDVRNPVGSWGRVFNGRLLIIHEDDETGEYLPTVYRIRPAVRGLKYPN